ncbi:MAG: YraN family protein [Proteobacteria bacterium]|nr:YraN family protein [Pseudomonadota bacterium]
MPNTKIEKGRRGEAEAVKLLRSSGYKIVEQNYRCPYGEIDIIAIDSKGKGKPIVFVEVKARTSERYGTAAEAVGARKQRHIIDASHAFIESKKLGEPYIRFDVITVMLGDNGCSVEHFTDAFGEVEV